MKLTREEANDIFDKMAHIGKGFEQKLKESLPIVYIYTKPGNVPEYKDTLVVDIEEYLSATPDLSIVPQGQSKYNYLDRCRDLVQKKLIDKIKESQANNKTFILFNRPRIEATTTFFNLKLEGKWVKDKSVKQIDAPEDIEDPFPCE